MYCKEVPEMKRKIILISAVVLLLVTSSIALAQNNNNSETEGIIFLSDTVYVDDSNTGVQNGSRANPYNNMDDALYGVADGGTIFVADGTYEGDFDIDVNVEIYGSDNTIFSMNGDSIYIERNKTVLFDNIKFDVVSNYNNPVIDGLSKNTYIKIINCNIELNDGLFCNIFVDVNKQKILFEKNFVSGSFGYVLVSIGNGSSVQNNIFNLKGEKQTTGNYTAAILVDCTKSNTVTIQNNIFANMNLAVYLANGKCSGSKFVYSENVFYDARFVLSVDSSNRTFNNKTFDINKNFYIFEGNRQLPVVEDRPLISGDNYFSFDTEYDYDNNLKVTFNRDVAYGFTAVTLNNEDNPVVTTDNSGALQLDLYMALTFNPQGGYLQDTVIPITGTTYENLPIPDKTGYTFEGWYTASVDGVKIENGDSIVNENHTIYAHWTMKTYDVVATSGPGGSVTGGGLYSYGDTITLTAIPDPGFEFVIWDDGTTTETRTETVNSGRSYNATFSEIITTPVKYRVELTSGPGGIAIGSGTYNEHDQIVISTVPNDGYKFKSWSDGNTNNIRILVMYQDYKFGATFEKIPVLEKYDISLDVENNLGGSVSGTGTYYEGTVVSISAIPNDGYVFDSWSDGGAQVHGITVSADANVTATFVKAAENQYNLSLSAYPSNGGSTEGSGTYTNGTVVPVNAVAAPGYRFVAWSDSSNIIHDVTVNSNISKVALFEKEDVSYELTLIAGEGGIVTGEGIYVEGTEVSVEAIPYEGYKFLNWSDNGSKIHDIIITKDTTLVAMFEPIKINYTLSLISSGNGAVGGGGTYVENSIAEIYATPATGYHFVKWSDGDTNAIRTYTVTQNTTLTATFEEDVVPVKPEYEITLISSDVNMGAVSGSGTYIEGTVLSISAIPNEGYGFVSWSDGGGQTHSFVVTENKTLTATFEKHATDENTVSLSAYPSDAGAVSGSGTYANGTEVTITAVANDGYRFVSWSDNGERTHNITVNSDVSMVAVFEKIDDKFFLRLEANAGGSISGAGTYVSGAVATVVATPSEGYKFVSWSDGGLKTHTIVMTKDLVLTAEFSKDDDANEKQYFEVLVTSSNGGSAFGGGVYEYGTSAMVFASPDTGYEFVSWSDGGKQTHKVIVTKAQVLTATFRQISSTDLYIKVDDVPDADTILKDLEKSNSGVRYELPDDFEGNAVISPEVFDSMTGKTLEFVTLDENGNRVYSISYDSSKELNPDYADDSDMNVIIKGSFDALEVDMPNVQSIVLDRYDDVDAFYINMYGTGVAPYTSVVKYYMGTDYAGEIYAVMTYHEGDLLYEEQMVSVDKKGYVSFTTEYDTKHVLISKEIVVDNEQKLDLMPLLVIAAVLLIVVVAVAYLMYHRN